MSTYGLILRYGAFAVLATVVNLATQRLILWGAAPQDMLHLGLAIAGGTLSGLVCKYLLDKRWIFQDRSSGALAHGRRFSMYTLTGVITTLIFWGSEFAAWNIWQSDMAREAGAVFGLSIGYVLKYQMDRRFVFPSTEGASS